MRRFLGLVAMHLIVEVGSCSIAIILIVGAFSTVHQDFNLFNDLSFPCHLDFSLANFLS